MRLRIPLAATNTFRVGPLALGADFDPVILSESAKGYMGASVVWLRGGVGDD